MLYRLYNLFILLSLLGGLASSAAASDVEGFEFKQADDKAALVDPDLNEWLAQYSSVMADGPAASASQLTKLPEGLDELSHMVASLYAVRTSDPNGQQALDTVDRALVMVNELLEEKSDKSHILYPYLLAELLAMPVVHPRVHHFLQEKLRNTGYGSCPCARLIIDDLTHRKWTDTNLKELRGLLGEIAAFKSTAFRRSALEMVLMGTPEALRGDIVEELRPLLEPFPKLMESHSWVLEPGAQNQQPKGAGEREVLMIRSAVARKSCGKARDLLQAALVGKGARLDLPQTELVAMKIEECYHPSGYRARLEFWHGIKEHLTAAQGFYGEELAMRRIASIKWAMDDFDEALDVFSEIRERAGRENAPVLQGNALYTLGRIEENQGHNEDAIAYYRQYIDEFAGYDKFDEAIMAATILLIEKNDKKAALALVQKIIDKYAGQPAISWDEGSLSFALFWAGQLLYDAGDKAAAAKMWRRLAGEFYSTYYGAIGHYLIEKMENKVFQLQPVRTVPFKWSEVYARLGTAERRIIDRAITLQRMGFRADALCEMAELPGGGNNYDRDLAIALLRYVMGDWLPAIKKYGELPHSYRDSLPQGMERILFPRAFVANIEKYATRLTLDADFIMAIIRQESVFNPRAVSSVGATGLMQLMPGTAAREVKKLKSNYLSDEERHRVPHGSAVAHSLYDADINLTIGVHHVHSLLQQFSNPVFMLSAYNANPAALGRWSRNIPSDNLLSFIERIPYKETKAYVKLVMRNYFYYKRWYRSPKASLPLLESLLPQAMRKGPIAPPKTNEPPPQNAQGE